MLGHFFLVSHNFKVTALGSCVKWPFDERHVMNRLFDHVHSIVSLVKCTGRHTKLNMIFSVPNSNALAQY